MRKKFTTVLVMLAFCLTATAAFAGVMSFPKFSVNVPDGWTASQDGPTVILVANDKSASISITNADAEGMALKDLALAMSQALKGSEQKANSDGAYEFTFKQGPVESYAIMMMEGKEYAMLAITGQNPQVETILNSLKENK